MYTLKCRFESKLRLTGYELKENETPKLQVTEFCLVKVSEMVEISFDDRITKIF